MRNVAVSAQSVDGGQQNPEQLAGLALGLLREKAADLVLPWRRISRTTIGSRLEVLFQFLEFGEAQLGKLETERTSSRDSQSRRKLPAWTTRVIASTLVAEIGANMEQFPGLHHLASSASLFPGNNESAGKRRSGKIRKGSVWLTPCVLSSGLGGFPHEENLSRGVLPAG